MRRNISEQHLVSRISNCNTFLQWLKLKEKMKVCSSNILSLIFTFLFCALKWFTNHYSTNKSTVPLLLMSLLNSCYIHWVLHTNKCTNYILVSNFYIETLKMLLHVSILRSSSGSTCCSLLKLHVNTFTAIVDLSRFNNSCLKSPASTLVDLTFQSRALRCFSLNQLRNLSL